MCSTGHVHYYYIWYLRPLQEQLLFEESPIQALKQMPQAKKEPLLSQSQPELEPRSKFWATVNTRNEAKGKLPTTPAYDKPPTGLSPPELQPTNEP